MIWKMNIININLDGRIAPFIAGDLVLKHHGSSSYVMFWVLGIGLK